MNLVSPGNPFDWRKDFKFSKGVSPSSLHAETNQRPYALDESPHAKRRRIKPARNSTDSASSALFMWSLATLSIRLSNRGYVVELSNSRSFLSADSTCGSE